MPAVLNPNPPVAGRAFQVSYNFKRPKTGGVIGIFPAGEPGCFGVEGQCDYLFAPALGGAGINGTSGTVSLTAPSTPGAYTLVTSYKPDGGSLDVLPFTVVAAPEAAVAPAIQVAPPAAAVAAAVAAAAPPVYSVPSPEPAASDGSRLSQQGGDIQSWYVLTFGPGMLAATQFVIDHQHQLAAIGASQLPPLLYTAPVPEPQAFDGSKLSAQSPDMQAFYVSKYGPGASAANGFVLEHDALTSVAPQLSLPAGPGAGGADSGLGSGVWTGGGGGFGGAATSLTVPATRQTGAPPPTVGGILSGLTAGLGGNHNLLLYGGAAAVAYYFLSGKHRR